MDKPVDDRDPLEVLAAEFMYRRRKGECPSTSEYVVKYPELATEIQELFPTIAAIEQLKSHKEESSGMKVSLGIVKMEQLGDFRILGEIGRGGMGIVYEAFQESLGRHVAMKVLPKQSLLDPKQLQRFQRESQTAARLHHTNIVPVFGVGEQEGFHYIVMQLIHGVGLDSIIANLQQMDRNKTYTPNEQVGTGPRSKLEREAGCLAVKLVKGHLFQPNDSGETGLQSNEIAYTLGFGLLYWRNVSAIGQQVADALHYAHSYKTLHRDIKPANLLLDMQGVVWITDFGLAKAMEHDNVTQTGGIVGTLRYMAPEQFSGHFDTRCDIYSLGLTLYELLTFRPAFEDDSRSSLIRKITQEEPVRPRKLIPGIPRDLETIVLKAISRDPAHRYQTAGEMARDLQCFLEDRPIQARRVSAMERVWRWSRRNRIVAGLAASTFVLLILVAIVASSGYWRIKQASVEEAKQRKKAENTSALALEALDNIFQQFAPDRIPSASTLTVVDDAGEEISVPVQPVLSKEAASLLEHMLAFYDRLAAQGGDGSKLHLKVAEANRRVGDIRQRLGQYDKSLAAYLRAVEIYKQLAVESQSDDDLQVEIVRIQNELGNVYRAMNEFDASQKAYNEVLYNLDRVAVGTSAWPRHQYELARTFYYIHKGPGGDHGPPPFELGGRRGPLHKPRRFGGPDETFGPPPPWENLDWNSFWPEFFDPFFGFDDASPERPARQAPPLPIFSQDIREQDLKKAIDILEKLVAAYPTVPDYRHLLARCYREIPFQWFGQRPDMARNYAGNAIGILQKLVQENPDVPDYRYDLSETYALLGSRGPFSPESTNPAVEKNVREMLEKALAISEELVAEHPNIPDYVVSQVSIRLRLSWLLQKNDQAGAEANLRKALDMQSALVRRFPNTPSYKFEIAIVRESLAQLLQDRGNLEEARTVLKDSISSLEDVLKSDSKAVPLGEILSHQYMRLSDVLRALGEEKAAAEAVNRSRNLRLGR